MVNSVIEIQAGGPKGSTPKAAPQTPSTDFMSLLGAASAQVGAVTPATSATPATKATPTTSATSATSTTSTTPVTPASTDQVVQVPDAAQAVPQAAATVKDQSDTGTAVQSPGGEPAQVAATKTDPSTNSGVPLPENANRQAAGTNSPKVSTVDVTTKPEADDSDKAPVTSDGSDSGVIQALKNLTVVQASPGSLPDAAQASTAVSSAIIAGRLTSAGNNAQPGELLSQTDEPSTTGVTDPGPLAKSAATQVAPAGKSASLPAVDPAIQATVEASVSGQVQAVTSSDADLQNSLQFSDQTGPDGIGKLRQPASAKSDDLQAFGVQLGSQVDGTTQAPNSDNIASAVIQADPTIGDKVVGQIVQQVVLHQSGDTSTLTVHLNPPELGTLKLNVTSQSGVVTTELESQSASVRSLLETHIPALRDALSNAGIEVNGVSVSAGNDFGQSTQGRQQAWQSAQPHSAASFALPSADQSNTEAATSSRPTITAGNNWLA